MLVRQSCGTHPLFSAISENRVCGICLRRAVCVGETHEMEVMWDLMRTRHLLGRDPCCETHASRSSASTFAWTENLKTKIISWTSKQICLDSWVWWSLLNLRIFCCFLRDVDHHCWYIDQHLDEVELQLQWIWTQENSTDIALARQMLWAEDDNCSICCWP